MTEIEELQHEVKKLKERNNRVDTNKAWETSITRKIALMILTYIVISLTLVSIKNPEPFSNAIIPAIAFFISTLTLPFIKSLWQKHIYNVQFIE